MDQEFDTICDDNSISEVSQLLIKFIIMLQNNQHDQIKTEFAQLPLCEMWIVPGGRLKIIANKESDSSSEDGEDEQMDTKDSNMPSTSGSTMKFQEEETDPGWTVVQGRKKK
jgi:pre-rRNA-processing protein TSR2